MPKKDKGAQSPARVATGQGRERGGRQLRALAALSLALVVMGACTAVLHAPAATLRGIGMMRIAASGGRAAGMQDVVLQRTSWDCGPAALASLATHLGVPSPTLDEIGRRAGTTPAGTTLGVLVRAARSLGIEARAVRVDTSARASVALPILAWVHRSHFVAVVAREGGNRVVILDPQIGRYSLPMSAFLRTWSGEALVIQP